jgi:hypothetical protein
MLAASAYEFVSRLRRRNRRADPKSSFDCAQ